MGRVLAIGIWVHPDRQQANSNNSYVTISLASNVRTISLQRVLV
jgi:hypothetical protein